MDCAIQTEPNPDERDHYACDGCGLVRHKGNYWALGEVDDVAVYASMLESTRAANDRFGEEDMDEWLEHAVAASYKPYSEGIIEFFGFVEILSG